jgi:two-component sensor histidine kinase
MIDLSGFQTVRARLLVLMAFVVIPIATMSLILATTSYRSVTASIASAQIETVSGYAVRARLWFRGSLRSLVSVVRSVQALEPAGSACNAMLRNVLDGIEGFEAIRIVMGDGVSCHATDKAELTPEVMDAIAREGAARAPSPSWNGPEIAQARFGAATVRGKLHLVIHAINLSTDERPWQAIVLVDPMLLQQAFAIGATDGTTAVALMMQGGKVLVERSASRQDWLPQNEIFGVEPRRWQSRRPGDTYQVYATQMVAEPDLYVLARFDNAAASAAYMQFLVLCVTPLLTLVVLFLAYARVIQFDVVRWIRGIEMAARAHKTRPDALAPIGPSMPQDIRLVAEAFNAMVQDGNRREDALRLTLDANQFLMRELNHRVKNSLQVIQSHLALSRRQRSAEYRMHFAETEAMVQVLSVAYRLALTEGTMRPVPIKPFVEEIMGSLSSSLRRTDQWTDVRVAADAGLVVDRIIPLGLGLVEAVIAALQGGGARKVMVQIETLDDGQLELMVTSDGVLNAAAPAPRIVMGLAGQLGALVADRAPGVVMHWIFRP